MIYTKKTKLAMNIAYKAHMNEFDHADVPYIYHPIHVAEKMTDEISTIIALLHDVVEDTDVTFEELSKYFDKEIINILKIITKHKNESYIEYIKRVKTNKIATKVKIEDIKHNKDLTRLDNVSEVDVLRIKKYDEALSYLLED